TKIWRKPLRPASPNKGHDLAGEPLVDGPAQVEPLHLLSLAGDLAGRLAVCALFWWSVFLDILPTWPATVDYVAAQGVPFPWAASAIAVVVEIGGPTLLLTPGLEAAGAIILAVYCVATAMLFHAFWLLDGDGRDMQLVHFLKNIALAGALMTFTTRTHLRT
ncbi:DoxX family protein, partial [Nostoc sp. NIES-2111]